MKIKSVLALLLACIALSSFASNRKVTVTFTPSMPLTPTNVELICSSMYSHLEDSAIQKLDIEETTPFSCSLSSDSKQLIMVFRTTV
jgi:hypothetical protein